MTGGQSCGGGLLACVLGRVGGWVCVGGGHTLDATCGTPTCTASTQRARHARAPQNCSPTRASPQTAPRRLSTHPPAQQQAIGLAPSWGCAPPSRLKAGSCSAPAARPPPSDRGAAMHIKQVIIEGFKSYKDQTATDPFSNAVNVIGAQPCRTQERAPAEGGGEVRGPGGAAAQQEPAAGARLSARGSTPPPPHPAWWRLVRCKQVVRRVGGVGAARARSQRQLRRGALQAAANALAPPLVAAVGANGSGKSNFFHGECACCCPLRAGGAAGGERGQPAFAPAPAAAALTTAPPLPPSHACTHARAAIRFVLNDLFTTLRQEDRQRLLHVRMGVQRGGAGGERERACTCERPLALAPHHPYAARRRARGTRSCPRTWRWCLITATGGCRLIRRRCACAARSG